MPKAKLRHGLTPEEIFMIADAQGMMCPLSKHPLEIRNGEIFDPTNGKRVSIDHDHQTMLVRGLLIEKVNWLIDQWERKSYGELSMPPEILQYKHDPPAQRVLPGKLFSPR